MTRQLSPQNTSKSLISKATTQKAFGIKITQTFAGRLPKKFISTVTTLLDLGSASSLTIFKNKPTTAMGVSIFSAGIFSRGSLMTELVPDRNWPGSFLCAHSTVGALHNSIFRRNTRGNRNHWRELIFSRGGDAC